MSEVLHANIFFLIASIATVVFCILICIVLYHVIKITIAVRRIVERIDAGSDMIAEDVTTIRNLVVSGQLLSRLISFVMPSSPRRRARKKQKDVTNESEE